MRATCEHCGGAQPRDWRAGEACVHCGKSVRSDVRCFWCVAWVPAGGFCRSCGAAGVDRYSIPKMVADMDPGQRENLERIYGRHAVAVARHVDDAAFLESFLFQQQWSAALDDELTAQLPLPPATLEKF